MKYLNFLSYISFVFLLIISSCSDDDDAIRKTTKEDIMATFK